ncbi:MAG: pantoate--beta-alanine ligase [Brevundimonas sp.]|uniref:pantoate--beta-alanine ligase n=1 Tax=Brevundimonas sp. TaxID=1871086 RepID=UPI004034D5E2
MSVSQAAPVPLQIVRTVAELRGVMRGWRAQGLSVALVPTMGALHEGHLDLVREGLRRADRVVTSVFVNPTQFAAHEDLGAYPRQQERDAELLDQTGGHLMFAPTVDEMYAPGAVTRITVGDAETGGPSQGLEGDFRPQMFGGVALVVAKLLNQVQADVAVFGEKDWQQLMVVRRMVRDLDIPTEIFGLPTVRDDHGLALSSRNAYLSADELQIARRLNVILREAADRAAAGQPLATVENDAVAALLEAGFDTVDYVAVRQTDSLAAFSSGVVEGPARILTAARIGRTRLIDNMAVQGARFEGLGSRF